MDLDIAARILAELGNRTRLEILRLLIKAGPEGLPIGRIQEHLDIPASTLAFHLRGLVGAGLVEQEKRGRTVLCRSRMMTINSAFAFVKSECCKGVPAQSTTRSKAA